MRKVATNRNENEHLYLRAAHNAWLMLVWSDLIIRHQQSARSDFQPRQQPDTATFPCSQSINRSAGGCGGTDHSCVKVGGHAAIWVQAHFKRFIDNINELVILGNMANGSEQTPNPDFTSDQVGLNPEFYKK
jgi:hypothetical protein